MEKKPRSEGRRARLATFVLRTFSKLFYYLRLVILSVTNRKVIPKSGPVIIACNHISILDPVFLWCVVRRPMVAMAMAQLWAIWAVRWVMNLLGHIPVDRSSSASKAKAVETAEYILHRGGVVLIFPEGKCIRRDVDKTTVRYYGGVYALSLKTNAPVIAANIAGTNTMLPLTKDLRKGERRFKPRTPIHLIFAETPMYASEYTSEEDFLASLRLTINDLPYIYS